MKSLVIVESGAKAKKIKGYLDTNFPDKDWQVEACVGHVRDLSDNENAVDPQDWKNLKWEFSSKGKKVMNKGMSYIEAMNCCHKGINGTQESKAIVVYMGVVSTANNLPCKPQ